MDAAWFSHDMRMSYDHNKMLTILLSVNRHYGCSLPGVAIFGAGRRSVLGQSRLLVLQRFITLNVGARCCYGFVTMRVSYNCNLTILTSYPWILFVNIHGRLFPPIGSFEKGRGPVQVVFKSLSILDGKGKSGQRMNHQLYKIRSPPFLRYLVGSLYHFSSDDHSSFLHPSFHRFSCCCCSSSSFQSPFAYSSSDSEEVLLNQFLVQNRCRRPPCQTRHL